MASANNYTAPPPTVGILNTVLPESELYGPMPYDINFAYPIHSETLESDRIKLVPFVPAIHASTFWKHVQGRENDLYHYYPFFLSTFNQTFSAFELLMRRNPGHILFAVLDKSRADPEHADWGGSLAGVVALFNTVPHNLTTEVAFVLVFPEFQKTHVAKSMIGVLLRYLLQLPSASPPGLGFRRVQWQAHPSNAPSIGLAQRMVFRKEGVLRWMWILPDELAEMGKTGREGDAFEDKTGRDTAMLSLYWDDWENGVRELVEATIRG
ncbi:acyl-CoA N-acyltransferase [Fomes fomentarius]|nr:acyl-CoA N-acyltransferase [Fomes fomentarius]